MEIFVENLKTLKVCLAEKDFYISTLEKTVVNIRKEFDDFKEEQNNKLPILEKFNHENISKIEKLMTKLEANDIKTKQNPIGRHNCTKCDFQTKSEKGLKTHMTRKHTDTTNIKYPKKCELCEKEYE